MNNKVVLASGNSGKHKEIALRLQPLGWDLSLQSEFAVPEVDESGATFIENAILKARNAAECTGHAALADDSGLVVPALAGSPGIHSARYAGVNSSYPEKFSKLFAQISALENKPEIITAHFYCVLVLMQTAADPAPIIAEGRWHGRLVSPRGKSGFGYDPIFYIDSLGCTAAELDLATKAQLSHRALALDQLLAKLAP